MIQQLLSIMNYTQICSDLNFLECTVQIYGFFKRTCYYLQIKFLDFLKKQVIIFGVGQCECMLAANGDFFPRQISFFA